MLSKDVKAKETEVKPYGRGQPASGERARRWREENRAAINFYKERIERYGLWHKDLTPWY